MVKFGPGRPVVTRTPAGKSRTNGRAARAAASRTLGAEDGGSAAEGRSVVSEGSLRTAAGGAETEVGLVGGPAAGSPAVDGTASGRSGGGAAAVEGVAGPEVEGDAASAGGAAAGGAPFNIRVRSLAVVWGGDAELCIAAKAERIRTLCMTGPSPFDLRSASAATWGR